MGLADLPRTGKAADVLPFASTGKPQNPVLGIKPQKQAKPSTGKPTLSGWKHKTSKPPIPEGYELSKPSGMAKIGRRKVVGYQVLWKTKCADCGERVRLVAAYIGPLALHVLLKEKRDVQRGIVGFKLLRFQRKQRQREASGNRPRCKRCAGQDIGSITLGKNIAAS